MEIPAEFLTWDKLTTFSGLVMGTFIITSFLKDVCKTIPTQLLSWLVAFTLFALANMVITGIPPWHDWILMLLNSITISLAANGAYSVCTRKSKQEPSA